MHQQVDQPACELCGSANTTHTGMVPPNLQEQAHAAQRVEAYHCSICNTVSDEPLLLLLLFLLFLPGCSMTRQPAALIMEDDALQRATVQPSGCGIQHQHSFPAHFLGHFFACRTDSFCLPW
jgi:hypothetical protein